MRSFLFVPGDSARKFEKARAGEADALILDLEDSVALEAKEAARTLTREMLAAPRGGQKLFVRVNALDTGLTLADLAAVMPLAPDGVVLPKSTGGGDIRQLSRRRARQQAAPSPARPGSWRWRPRRRSRCSAWTATRGRARGSGG